VRRILREPLLHVVVLGALLFALHRRVAPAQATGEIVISNDAFTAMREQFLRTTGRIPSATDEQNIADQLADDEVLVREALALGLDRGDVVVRRRLIEKMRLLLEETERVPPPTDADLEAYLRAHAATYTNPARVTFTQVFISAQRAGDQAMAEAAALKTRLDGGADATTLGDPFPRGREFRLHSQAELAAIFGAAFASEVMKAPTDAWSGPIGSTYGAHLVRIWDRQAGTEPVLADVRARVERDWRLEQRRIIDQAGRERRRSHYAIRFEGPTS
jgi:hypothetical protein